jgi:Helix-turn-helix domain
MTAQQVAEEYGVSRQWVYENKQRIGYSRINDGPSSPIRFDREVVDRFMEKRFHRPVARRGRPRQTLRKTGYRVEPTKRGG